MKERFDPGSPLGKAIFWLCLAAYGLHVIEEYDLGWKPRLAGAVGRSLAARIDVGECSGLSRVASSANRVVFAGFDHGVGSIYTTVRLVSDHRLPPSPSSAFGCDAPLSVADGIPGADAVA